jgi:DNA-binding IclR family transcriptional regulator
MRMPVKKKQTKPRPVRDGAKPDPLFGLNAELTAGKGMSSTLKCLKVLDLLATEPYVYSLGEVVELTGYEKGTAHRLLATLVEGGYAGQDDDTRRYFVAGKAFSVGSAYLRHHPVNRAAYVVMNEMAPKVAGMIHLGTLDRGTLLFLRTVGHPSSYYSYSDAGDRLPLHANAMGKAILAFGGEALLHEAMRAPHAFTERTIVSIDKMRRELTQVRARGVALNDGEWTPGLRAVAAPIFERRGAVVASLAIGGPTPDMNKVAIEKYSRMAREGAGKISSLLGYRGLDLKTRTMSSF